MSDRCDTDCREDIFCRSRLTKLVSNLDRGRSKLNYKQEYNITKYYGIKLDLGFTNDNELET